MRSALLLLLLAAARLSAQDLAGFEKVLLPLALERGTPGLASDDWTTRFFAHNRGSGPALVYSAYKEGAPNFQRVEARTLTQFDFARYLTPLLVIPTPSPARVMYVERGAEFDYFGQANLGGAAPSFEVPVVRERDFRTGTIVLPGVPSGRGRVLLNVYAPDREPRVEFIVRAGDRAPFTVVAQQPGLAGTRYDSEVTFATWTQVELVADARRISVSAADPRTRFWAMVTVDDGVQPPLLISPQTAAQTMLLPLVWDEPWKTTLTMDIAGSTFQPKLSDGAKTPPGRLFTLDPSLVPQTHLHLRVSNAGRSFEVPVVPEQEFRRGTLVLSRVKLVAPDEQVVVHLYAPDREENVEFVVHFRPQEPGATAFQRHVTARRPAAGAFATYAEIDLTGAPERPSPPLRSDFDVEIATVNPATRFWAMATVRRVATDEVLVVSPQ